MFASDLAALKTAAATSSDWQSKNSIMGNSRLAAKCHLSRDIASQPPASGANGILGRIQGQYIAEATNLLPPAATSTATHQEIDLDAGPAGRVRFFAERKQAKHHRHSHYFWSVYRAEPVDDENSL